MSRTAGLEEGLIATGFPYIQDERENDNLGNFNRVTVKARGTAAAPITSTSPTWTATDVTRS